MTILEKKKYALSHVPAGKRRGPPISFLRFDRTKKREAT